MPAIGTRYAYAHLWQQVGYANAHSPGTLRAINVLALKMIQNRATSVDGSIGHNDKMDTLGRHSAGHDNRVVYALCSQKTLP